MRQFSENQAISYCDPWYRTLEDPIEMSAIGQVLKKMQLDSSVVGAGAIKTLFGHRESIAGWTAVWSLNSVLKIRNINLPLLKDWAPQNRGQGVLLVPVLLA